MDKKQNKNKKPAVWQRHRIEKGPHLEILQARFDWLKHPGSQKEMKRLVLEANDWVNIVATTPNNEIQAGSFRHSLALLALTKVFDLWNGNVLRKLTENNQRKDFLCDS